MSDALNTMVSVSLLALASLLFYRDYKARSWKGFVFHAVVLIACAGFFRRFYDFWKSSGVVAKGVNVDDKTWPLIILLYLFMLAGMLANYGHRHFSIEKARRGKWDFGLFVAPMFVSPIIFIPLFIEFQKAGSDSGGVISFFMAFQNGFLWKEYFDHKKKRSEGDGS